MGRNENRVENQQKVFIDMVQYCMAYRKKVCLYFLKDYKLGMKLFSTSVPKELLKEVSLNLGTKTVNFKNGSKIIFKTPNNDSSTYRGFKIDMMEEFSLLDSKTYAELRTKIQ